MSELSFWNEKYIEASVSIYRYRKGIRDFFSENTPDLKEYFFGKAEDISFEYVSKTDLDAP
jgi:hypothetical protein